VATQSKDLVVYRPETMVHTINLKYSDLSADYALTMGKGVYMARVIIETVTNFAATSGTVAVGSITPFLNATQTIVADVPLRMYDAATVYGAGITVEVTMSLATAYNKYLGLVGQYGALFTADGGPWAFPYGLRISWTNSLVLGPTPAGEINVRVLTSRVA